ncbi:MAG: hypothetical protein AB199_04185 [Parcubacteria bacterium C7867-004]|nr:MAG: hypothetical protein AB199_04185 [Parcubacteria bacterium C7867-004]
MKGSIIFALHKSPYPKRKGPSHWADWYRGCLKAVDIQRVLDASGVTSEMLVLTDAQYKGGLHEVDYYTAAFDELGAHNVRVIRKCYETVRQIEMALQISQNEDKDLIVISTWVHYLRVCWLLRGSGATHRIAFGIPNLQYAIADVILTFAFPVIDLVPGGRERFVAYAEDKRFKGEYQ